MKDHDIDYLVAHAAPPTDTVTSPSLSPLMAELREHIVTTDNETQEAGVVRPLVTAGNRRDKTRLMRLVGAAAAATVLAVTATVLGVGVGGGTTGAYAAEIVAVAEEAPRLLITQAGWSVTYADAIFADHGELTFSDGELTAVLRWLPAVRYDEIVASNQARAAAVTDIAIAGDDAQLIAQPNGTRTALWVRGDHSVELRIYEPTDEETFLAVAGSLGEVDVDTWLDALPESTVHAQDRRAVVSEMLTGVPVPDTFDAASLDSTQPSDRYQLGATVVGAVTCQWLAQWVDADHAGNEARRTEAAQALATSTEWPVLLDMNAEGDYPEAVWGYASAINDGNIDLPDGVTIFEFGSELVAADYQQSFGCGSDG